MKIKTKIISLCLLASSCLVAQKTDKQSIKYEFDMYPLETISKDKVVDINVFLDYTEKSKAKLAEVEAKKEEAKKDKEDYSKKKFGEKLFDKAVLGNSKPSGQFNNNEFIPELFDISTMETAININNFSKKEGSNCVVNATFSEFKYTILGSTINYYPNKVVLSVNNDKGVNVYSGDLPNNSTSMTYIGTISLSNIKTIETRAKDMAIQNLNTFLNQTYGFNLIKDWAYFFDIKDKKFDYPDYHEAINKIESAFLSVNNPERQEKFTSLLKESIQIWENNLKLLDKNNKDAKINKYVAAATTLNLAVAYAWLKDFNKAYDFLEDHKALDENYDNTYNADLKFIKNYSERYNKFSKY